MAFALVSSSIALPAQRTWIVDPGGKGDYKRISDAVTAAKNGDRILVRPGKYAERPTILKSLTLLGTKATVDGFLVRGLTKRQPVVLSGFAVSTGKSFSLENSRGHVALSGCSAKSFPFEPTRSVALIINNCHHVTVHSCSFVGTGVRITGSEVSIAQSTISGVEGAWTFLGVRNAEPGIRVTASHVVLGNTTVTGGGTGAFFKDPEPEVAIQSQRSVVIVGAPSSLLAGRFARRGEAPAVRADAATKLFLDPTVLVQASDKSIRAIVGTKPISLVIPALATVITRKANRDFVLATTVSARANWVSGLLIGLPGPRRAISRIGDLWFDPQQPVLLLDVGPLAKDGRRAITVPLPASLPDGTRLTLQSVLLASTGKSLRLSTSTTVVLR